ncbi:Chemotaxis protein histidine kinase CheA [endosymbiont of Ridgeia piscesae]|jgi:two-component system chemotaxis sensor kinase CheA|uniref:Chemotaxis protein CheA n=3 Tax=endosymbiont of Ridgeia piscesae TaxID=54398 RepID=A0A0T5YZ81_9GAMM|nr:chemotaxis protein CheA [endosymbiont of Ridgeia piscesae]KRT55622.1 Chemotaxis protein histidine kinase CheA [endosymbiont of Ridgeia piscesae]
MAIDVNDEILQDFLVEAGEILEQLSEQLVDLEQRPEDYDLLNAVFRGFHTIKGGAGFLGIEALVEVCHRAEDVFNVLRQGQRSIDANLMDVVLNALDVVNEMFDSVRNGIEPEHAAPALIQSLHSFSVPEAEAGAQAKSSGEESSQVQAAAPAESVAPATAKKGELSDAEFEELLESIQEPAHAAIPNGNDKITEDEFENLLDELHGKGKFTGMPTAAVPGEAQSAAESDSITEQEFDNLLDELHGKGKFKPPASAQAVSVGADEITEEEFEALLDELHGKGKFAGASAATAASPEQPVVPKTDAAPQQAASPKPQQAAESKKTEPVPKTKPGSAPAVPKTKPAKAETTVRVDTQRLDDIMNMVGELVLVRNRLATLKATLNDEELANAVSNLDVVTSDLQLSVMKTRMQPIKKVFGRFPRVVRDLARSLKKEIDLEMVGEDTDLDKNLVEALADPLVHLVRNSVDHGIEQPEERERMGKPRRGTVQLAAAQEGDHILLSISDDGHGMDPDVLRRKVVEKGLMDQESASRLDDRECFNLIFQPGFSTKTEISDVSGRGVGMDVVKTRIAQMNGSVEIDSELGRGSVITIKLPLTLAILPTLMVILSTQPFALPLANVVEIFNLDLKRTNVVDGQLTIMVRERALPLFYLREWLVPTAPPRDKERGLGHVVVVNIGNIQVGLVVDELIGQEEVVIKPLGAMLQGMEGMAGATITGDGKIALILDMPGLMRKYARKF